MRGVRTQRQTPLGIGKALCALFKLAHINRVQLYTALGTDRNEKRQAIYNLRYCFSNSSAPVYIIGMCNVGQNQMCLNLYFFHFTYLLEKELKKSIISLPIVRVFISSLLWAGFETWYGFFSFQQLRKCCWIDNSSLNSRLQTGQMNINLLSSLGADGGNRTPSLALTRRSHHRYATPAVMAQGEGFEPSVSDWRQCLSGTSH